MKFICLGYFDETKWASLAESEQATLMEECMAYDDELRSGKHFLGGEALGAAANAVTLKMKNGGVEVLDGPFTETKEILGGILLLEAKDLNHAIALISKHPGVKNGPFEIRCVDEAVNQQIAERNKRFSS
ncbi:YciI family protein [Paraglaciecola sp.]|uniref:YciI family protein n=1 Tax=Paraglaciecola sp. TaxID=1920173 RepID=UPI0030F3C943